MRKTNNESRGNVARRSAARRLAAPLTWLLAASTTPGCGSDRDETRTLEHGADEDREANEAGSQDASVPTIGEEAGAPTGDPTVFSEIDVQIRVYGTDSPDSSARDEAGNIPAEPPLRVSVGAVVEINGGEFEGRVPGLSISGDGVELTEVGSAGVPQRFSFQYFPSDTVHGQKLELGFSYQGATVSLRVQPLLVEVLSPAADRIQNGEEPFSLEWTGVDAPPDQVFLFEREPDCVFSYVEREGNTFVPEQDPSGTSSLCRFELTANWSVVETEPSPFRSLELTQTTRRIVRFTVQ